MELVDRPDPTTLTWQVSRRCNAGDCVGVARDGDTIFLGDSDSSKSSGAVLAYSRPEWQAFLARIKRGELDFS